ncbi:MAG: SpoIIE family protein phosphatase [Verrucomicrobiota bacterium]
MNLHPSLRPPIGIVRHAIPADTALVAPLRQAFMDTLVSGPFSESDLVQWQLVFSEVVFNAIVHGARSDASQVIIVEWSITPDTISLVVQDPGDGPPEALLQAPTLPSDATAESGRGLFIITTFADELQSWRGPQGFRLEVLKHYPNQSWLMPGNAELDGILEELSSCYESLTVFHRLTGNLIERGNLRDFIDDALKEFVFLHPLDRIFFQAAPAIPDTVCKILGTAAWFLDPNDADPCLRTLGALTRETVWENSQELSHLNLGINTVRSIGAGCVFPIVAGDLHFGALIVLRKPGVTEQKSRSLGTLRTLADLCGIACANTHLTKIHDLSQKDLHELEIAVEIQKALLPILPAPTSPHWHAAIFQQSSLTIAGDYAIARTDSAGNLVLAMIDVMGKGVSAALLASIFRTAFDLSLHLPASNTILETINRSLCYQLGNLSMFITCTVARVSADGKVLDHASAGHCPTFFYRADGQRSFLNPSGPPLGILSDVSYTNERVALTGGERLVMVTDGCYEWDRRDEDCGWQEFVRHLDSHCHSTPEQLWQHLCQRISDLSGPHLADDCTILTLDIHP